MAVLLSSAAAAMKRCTAARKGTTSFSPARAKQAYLEEAMATVLSLKDRRAKLFRPLRGTRPCLVGRPTGLIGSLQARGPIESFWALGLIQPSQGPVQQL